jgi:hypothetical protein
MVLYLLIGQCILLTAGACAVYRRFRKLKLSMKVERYRVTKLVEDSAAESSRKLEERLASVLRSSIEASEKLNQSAIKTVTKNLKGYIDDQLGTVVTVVSPYKES